MSAVRLLSIFVAFFICGSLFWPETSYGRSRSASRGGTQLYVLLGLSNNSPGLAEFGSRMQQRGIPTMVRNHGEWQVLAQDAIQRYQSGQLRSIEIVGHSLGGDAAVQMAAQLGQAGVPVKLVVTLDPTGGPAYSPNVRRSVNLVPQGNENHFSMIAAQERQLTSYVLSAR